MNSEPTIDGVPAMLMRGGTSKGLFFLAEHLPVDPPERDELLLAIMGSPDDRQIDGLGGAHPLTSKVAIVAPAADADTDADLGYLFLQVSVDEARVSDRQNCGNMLAGVAPFALERGLIPTPDGESAHVAIRMLNTGGIAAATITLAGGRVRYDGDTVISGVPGSGAPIRLDFDGIAGASCGSLLPTANTVDTIEGVDVTLIDNGMPVVVIAAAAMGIDGCESPAELEANGGLRQKLEAIRLKAGPMMNLGDVADTTVPKLTMVSPPLAGGALNTRTFIPHRCHDAIGVLGAVSVATAARLSGSPAAEVANPANPANPANDGSMVVEHPTGSFEAAVTLSFRDGQPVAERSGIIRTARKLMDGVVFPRP